MSESHTADRVTRLELHDWTLDFLMPWFSLFGGKMCLICFSFYMDSQLKRFLDILKLYQTFKVFEFLKDCGHLKLLYVLYCNISKQ